MLVPLLTKKEVSSLLRRSISSINRDIDRGRIRPVRLGGSVRFLATDIERILHEGFFPDESELSLLESYTLSANAKREAVLRTATGDEGLRL